MERPDVIGGVKPGHARLKAIEVLADGKWHDRRKVVSLVAAAVPPGPALRTAKKRRVVEVDDSDPEIKQQLVRSGQRATALDALNDKARFERKGNLIRMLPYPNPTPEQRSESSRKAAASMTAKQRSERGHKAAATRRKAREQAKKEKSHPSYG